jgi:Skp family chaperone for outer membrane proteins
MMRSIVLFAAAVSWCAASGVVAQNAVILPGAASRPAAAPSAAPAFPVGFVDVMKVLAEYNKASELQNQLKKDLDTQAAGVRRSRETVAGMKESLEMLATGSKEWLDHMKKIRLAEIDVEITERSIKFDLEVKYAEVIRKVYADVLREVKAIAEEKGYKLVLAYQPGEISNESKNAALSSIAIRPVLYFDPGADLTAETLARLNK